MLETFNPYSISCYTECGNKGEGKGRGGGEEKKGEISPMFNCFHLYPMGPLGKKNKKQKQNNIYSIFNTILFQIEEDINRASFVSLCFCLFVCFPL